MSSGYSGSLILIVAAAIIFSGSAACGTGMNGRGTLPSGGALTSFRDAPVDRSSREERPSVPPPSVFDGGRGVLNLDSFNKTETLKLSGRRLSNTSLPPGFNYRAVAAAPGTNGSGGRKRIALSVLASALLPGLGEMYLYLDSGNRSALYRAPVFMALEGYFWYGYKTNHDKGKDFKSQYEQFCDEHWSEERFLLQHPYCDGIGGCESWEQYNEEAKNDYWYFVYIPRNLDVEEYYENCGKYDAFAFGWDDWNGDYDDFQPWTPNRTYYWHLRGESDKYLVRGDQFLMLTIVNRVVSMIDAGWLAYRMNKNQAQEEGWSLELESSPVASSIGLSYRF